MSLENGTLRRIASTVASVIPYARAMVLLGRPFDETVDDLFFARGKRRNIRRGRQVGGMRSR